MSILGNVQKRIKKVDTHAKTTERLRIMLW